MNKPLSLLTQKGKLILPIGIAALVGGLTSAVVLAAIPDSGGIIHGCYKTSGGQTGALRVIDSDIGATCTTQESALNWSQSGGGGGSGAPSVYDGNGRLLGTLLATGNATPGDPPYSGIPTGLEFFNTTLHRVVRINNDGDTGLTSAFPLYYQSTDCSGQPYEYYSGVEAGFAKTELLRWDGPTPFHGIVADSAQTTTITVNSELSGGSCQPGDSSTQTVLPVTPVTLPYTNPVATPVKLNP